MFIREVRGNAECHVWMHTDGKRRTQRENVIPVRAFKLEECPNGHTRLGVMFIFYGYQQGTFVTQRCRSETNESRSGRYESERHSAPIIEGERDVSNRLSVAVLVGVQSIPDQAPIPAIGTRSPADGQSRTRIIQAGRVRAVHAFDLGVGRGRRRHAEFTRSRQPCGVDYSGQRGRRLNPSWRASGRRCAAAGVPASSRPPRLRRAEHQRPDPARKFATARKKFVRESQNPQSRAVQPEPSPPPSTRSRPRIGRCEPSLASSQSTIEYQ